MSVTLRISDGSQGQNTVTVEVSPDTKFSSLPSLWSSRTGNPLPASVPLSFSTSAQTSISGDQSVADLSPDAEVVFYTTVLVHLSGIASPQRRDVKTSPFSTISQVRTKFFENASWGTADTYSLVWSCVDRRLDREIALDARLSDCNLAQPPIIVLRSPKEERGRRRNATGSFRVRCIALFNYAQVATWSFSLLLLLAASILPRFAAAVTVYFRVAQSGSILQVVLVALEIVRADMLNTVLPAVPRTLFVWFVVAIAEPLSLFHYVAYLARAAGEVLQHAYYLRQRNQTLLFFKNNAFLVLYPVAVFGGELPLIWRKSDGAAGMAVIVVYGIVAVGLYTRIVMARWPAKQPKGGARPTAGQRIKQQGKTRK
jgi:hypothetical protein